MKKKIIYIAGPFRASTPWQIEQNIRTAEAAALALAKQNYIPLCPHTMYRFFQDSLPDQFWLSATLQLLNLCDAIYLLPNYKNSQGSLKELERAKELNLTILHFDANTKTP